MNDKDLNSKLFEYTDPESAIAVYKEAAGRIKALKATQVTARAVIEKYLANLGEREVTTAAGKAAYTVSKTPRLDKQRWVELCLRNESTADAQHFYDISLSELRKAQDAYGCLVLPPGKLRIT